jgi:hypothetical protein
MHIQQPDDPLAQWAQRVAKQPLALPALCLIASHRPLAFVASQTLYLCAPLAELLGWPAWQRWAAALSDPTQVGRVEALLAERTRP